MSQIVEIDDDNIDKVNVFDNIDENKLTNNDKPPHNDKPITNIELSPHGNYLISYSQDDNSILGLNVENVNEDQPKLKFHVDLTTVGIYDYVKCMCVSEDMKLVVVSRSRGSSKLSK